MLRLIQFLHNLGAALSQSFSGTVVSNPSWGRTDCSSLASHGLCEQRVSQPTGWVIKNVASVASRVTQSYSFSSTTMHQLDHCAPGQGCPWPQAILAHTGGIVSSAL